MNSTRQMALRQNINRFCKKYKYPTDISDIKHLMKNALEDITLSNFMNSRVNDTNTVYVRATIIFLGEVAVKNGCFTVEQVDDLHDIGSEIEFCV